MFVNPNKDVKLSPEMKTDTFVKTKKKNYFLKHWQLYSMILPGLFFFVVFKYVPLLGSVIAFQDYSVFRGFFESEWVGLKHFANLFSNLDFLRILNNTLLISLYHLLFGFAAPIILALLMNEVKNMAFNRTIQSLVYLPHFLSWVIVGGLVMSLLSPEGGLVNEVVGLFGIDPIFFMQEPEYFRSIIVSSSVWKEVGWGAIIYLAALSGINPDLYEAAEIDGAGKFRQAISISLPCLLPTIIVLFLLRIGHILDLGFEQVYIFLNPLVAEKGEIIDTYVYQVGLLGAQFSYTTAIGLFKSVVGLILIITANQLSKKFTNNSIF
jgi:putative aldouronate transport system permease protein